MHFSGKTVSQNSVRGRIYYKINIYCKKPKTRERFKNTLIIDFCALMISDNLCYCFICYKIFSNSSLKSAFWQLLKPLLWNPINILRLYVYVYVYVCASVCWVSSYFLIYSVETESQNLFLFMFVERPTVLKGLHCTHFKSIY